MVKFENVLIIGFLVYFFCSCGSAAESKIGYAIKAPSNKIDTENEMFIFAKEEVNGMIKTQRVGDISYTCMLLPTMFLEQNDNSDILAFQDTSLIYFIFQIEVGNSSEEFLRYQLNNYSEYDDRVKYCAFDMEKDFKVGFRNDSCVCSIFHFERSFGLKKQGVFHLAFPRAVYSQKEFTLVFNDKLFHNGPLKFQFTPAINPKAILL